MVGQPEHEHGSEPRHEPVAAADGDTPPRVSFPGELDEDDLVEERPSWEPGPEPSSPPPEAIWGAP